MKYPDYSNLQEKGFIYLDSVQWYRPPGWSLWRALEAAGHITSMGRKYVNAHIQLALSFIAVQDPSPEDGTTHFEDASSHFN